MKVAASGITSDNRPYIVLNKENDNVCLWYLEAFFKPEDALEFLKTLYRDGVSQEQIEYGWLTLQELQEEKTGEQKWLD